MLRSLRIVIRKPNSRRPNSPKKSPLKAKKPVALEQNGNGRRNSALSLSSLKRNKQQAEELKQKKAREKKTENLPQDPFTHEAFQQVWQEYIDSLIRDGEKDTGFRPDGRQTGAEGEHHPPHLSESTHEEGASPGSPEGAQAHSKGAEQLCGRL